MSLTTCPHCHTDLRGDPIPEEYREQYGATHYSRVVGVEIRGVYDGVLFWACPVCHGCWHRWDSVTSTRLWEKAQEHMRRYTEAMQRAKPSPDTTTPAAS